MRIAISSVLTACIFVTVLLTVLCAMMKSNRVLMNVGPKLLIGGMLLVVVRMFVPVDFRFTYSVYWEEALYSVRRFLIPELRVGVYTIQMYQIVLAVWFGGAIVSFCWKLSLYCRYVRLLSTLPALSWEDVAKRDAVVYDISQTCKPVRLVQEPCGDSPYVIGLRKPYIVLPDFALTDAQFRYVMLHELMHVKNNDVVWKFLIDFLCTAFWWNPVFYFAKNRLFELIELRNDDEICALLSDEERINYMQALVDVARQMLGRDMFLRVSFGGKGKKQLKKRLKMIAEKKPANRWMQAGMLVILICLLLASYTVVFEQFSLEQADIGEKGVWAMEDNTVLIRNGEQYEVYINGKYVFTTDDLRPFPGVVIYNNLEEMEENEK